MSRSVYTLLIVESPVLANIIQNLAPQSVYVMATSGYCWNPVYDENRNELKTKADPDKIEIRRELKEQSKWASSVVIATDSDPSGDFIAWSVAKYLKKTVIQRGILQHLSKNGIIEMLDDVREIDISLLGARLKNLFLIHSEWRKVKSLPSKELAGLASLFGTSGTFSHFLDDEDRLFKSSVPVLCDYDEWIPVKKSDETQYKITEPLSTFDLLEDVVQKSLTPDYNEAQVQLQRLFQTVLPNSRESLISYPRTAANSFYGETWENFKGQFIKESLHGDLKPLFLQESAAADQPHESIYPLNLAVKPDVVSGETLKIMADLYEIIYTHTLSSIKIPVSLHYFFENNLKPDVYFYSVNEIVNPQEQRSLRPCLTVSDLGKMLHQLGVAKPSNFGERMDEWIARKWIAVNERVVTPLPKITRLGNRAADLKKKLTALKILENRIPLLPETVRQVLSS